MALLRGQTQPPTPPTGNDKVSVAPLDCNDVFHPIVVDDMDKALGTQGVSNYPCASNTFGQKSPTVVQQPECIETIAENDGLDVDKNPARARQNDKSAPKPQYFVTTIITIYHLQRPSPDRSGVDCGVEATQMLLRGVQIGRS